MIKKISKTLYEELLEMVNTLNEFKNSKILINENSLSRHIFERILSNTPLENEETVEIELTKYLDLNVEVLKKILN